MLAPVEPSPQRVCTSDLIFLFAACGLLGLLGCGGPAESRRPTTSVSLPVRPEKAASPSYAVEACPWPAQLTVDGDLSEWGDLPSAPHANRPVAVALSSAGVAIAARLDERADFWLAIGGFPTEVPAVGRYAEIGGDTLSPVMGVVVDACAPGPDDGDADPEQRLPCLAERKRIADEARAYEARFVSWIRIESSGVRRVTEQGVSDVSTAKIASQPGPAGFTIEATIPLEALPRFSEAPLTSVRLAIHPGSAAPPSVADDAWLVTKLPAPVAFEPMADLRALAFETSQWMSYQPAAPLDVEVTRYPSYTERSAFEVKREPLYARRMEIGDVEIGLLAQGLPADSVRAGVSDRVSLLVRRRGAPPKAIPLGSLPAVFVERGGEAHVLCYTSNELYVHDGSPNASFLPAHDATWSGQAIDRDGNVRDLEFDGDAPATWEDVEPFHDATSIGVRGSSTDWTIGLGKRGDTTELRWRWEAKKAVYVLERTRNGRKY
jgi:hypothetical protein